MTNEVQHEFNKVQGEFKKVYIRFDEIDQRFVEIDKRFDGVETSIRHLRVLFEDQMSKLQAIAENFGTLELHRQQLVDHDERIVALETARPLVVKA